MDTPNPPEPGRVNSAEDLAVPGLTDEEADAFVAAVDGRGPAVGEGVPVRAVDVLAGASDEVPCECGVIHHVTMKPEVILGLLVEAAGGGGFAVVDGVLCAVTVRVRCLGPRNEPGWDLRVQPVLGEASDG